MKKLLSKLIDNSVYNKLLEKVRKQKKKNLSLYVKNESVNQGYIFECKLGNDKLPVTTLIYNMETALGEYKNGQYTGCSSDRKKMCKFGRNGWGEYKNSCYAQNDETRYKVAYEYHKRQEFYWVNNSAETFISDAKRAILETDNIVNSIRFNEAGDMKSSKCLQKVIAISKALPHLNIFLYTHRKDIMKNITVDMLPSNLSINLSYKSNKTGFNSFVSHDEIDDTRDSKACIQSCRLCNLCYTNSNVQILANKH